MLVRRILILAAGGGIVAAFFFGTLFFIDYFESKPLDAKGRDSLRADHAKSIKKALANYRSDHGSYPIFPDNPVEDLKTRLVGGGYLREIPIDPSGKSGQYHYVSNGTAYGLLFHIELAIGNIPAGGLCLTGVETAGKPWYGAPPSCPF